MVLTVLQIVGAVATILTGLVSVFFPRAVFGFTGLNAPGQRGISEIRSVLGGLFVGVGAAPFILQDQAAYQMLGIMYLAIAAVRLVSIFVDKSFEQSNIISLVVEIVFGVVLVLYANREVPPGQARRDQRTSPRFNFERLCRTDRKPVRLSRQQTCGPDL